MSFVPAQIGADIDLGYQPMEISMSHFSNQTMTNHHDGAFARLAETLHVWRERQHTRKELAHLSERDLHDVGLSSSDAAYEADKPFWQA